MNIGFWNINSVKIGDKKDLSDSLVLLTLEKELDIICIAEIKDDTILSFLEKVIAKLQIKDIPIDG